MLLREDYGTGNSERDRAVTGPSRESIILERQFCCPRTNEGDSSASDDRVRDDKVSQNCPEQKTLTALCVERNSIEQ